MNRHWLLASIILLVGCVLWFFSDQRNRYYVAGEVHLSGHAQFVGVGIGTDAEEARRRLAVAGFAERAEPPAFLRTCGSHPIAEGAAIIRFEDRTWRQGKLCVVELDGWVVAMNVNYGWQFIT